MNDTLIDPAPTSDPHADKYNDPRVRVTRRGILVGLGVVVFAVVGAVASVNGRRTHLEKTTKFWGEETITALQLGERVRLMPKRGKDFPA
ncbi:MAG: hypothetical protein MI861_13065, partial [Pirellulales bacterium]|nr:hypothetical protein [Pirellulales bacterium]